MRWPGHLVHTGTFAGFAPTGHQLTLAGMSFYKVREGKITETRNQADIPGFTAQLEASAPG